MAQPTPEQIDDPAWCEREYAPRLRVPDASTYTERWPVWAAATRARLAHVADIRTGPHPRETIDLCRAEDPRGAVVFIHGGYWRAFSKHDFSWVADALVPAGVTVALVNYPLCPEVTVGDIAASCRRSLARLWQALDETERTRLVVCGHSAGGYLTAALLATDWTAHGLPADPFCAGVPISGVFDLRPLVATSMNADIRLTRDTAHAWSLHATPLRVRVPMTVAVGADESPEFLRQSADQAAASPTASFLAVPGRHHFDVVEGLREPESPLFKAVLAAVTGDSAAQPYRLG